MVCRWNANNDDVVVCITTRDAWADGTTCDRRSVRVHVTEDVACSKNYRGTCVILYRSRSITGRMEIQSCLPGMI